MILVFFNFPPIFFFWSKFEVDSVYLPTYTYVHMYVHIYVSITARFVAIQMIKALSWDLES